MTPSVPEIPDVHPTVLRLPEYLSGQLSDAERSEVERHIQSCPACKEELDSMAGLRAELKDTVDRAPGPSARVRAEVFRRLDERLAPRIGLADRFAEAFRWVLQPKWAPALAVLIIAGQLGALAWLTVRPGGEPEVQVRGLPTGVHPPEHCVQSQRVSARRGRSSPGTRRAHRKWAHRRRGLYHRDRSSCSHRVSKPPPRFTREARAGGAAGYRPPVNLLRDPLDLRPDWGDS